MSIADLKSNLVLHYPLYKSSVSGTTIKDTSGKGHNGTLSGSALTYVSNSKKYDGAYRFKEGNYITISNQSSFLSSLKSCTICCWIKGDDMNCKNIILDSNNNNNWIGTPVGAYFDCYGSFENNNVKVYAYRYYNNNYNWYNTGLVSLSNNYWNFVCVTNVNLSVVTSIKMLMGKDNTLFDSSTYVDYSDFRIYNKALTEEEAKQVCCTNTISISKTGVLSCMQIVDSKANISFQSNGQVWCKSHSTSSSGFKMNKDGTLNATGFVEY